MAGTDKRDMSKICGTQYESMRYKAHVTKEITEEEWQQWYKDHCGKCMYMHEICMYGE